MNLKLNFLLLIPFFSVSQENNQSMKLDLFVKTFETAVENAEECERKNQKTRTECKESISYFNTSHNKDLKELTRELNDFTALDFDKAILAVGAATTFADMVFSSELKKHNKQG
jgi:1-aminocyclopropane-1-carboxylate deaminase/D-cysteine desulfhydrase-like pyridoxal-dependent ACC family enzyme